MNGRGFLRLNEATLTRIKVSIGFEPLVSDIQELVHNYSHNQLHNVMTVSISGSASLMLASLTTYIYPYTYTQQVKLMVMMHIYTNSKPIIQYVILRE